MPRTGSTLPLALAMLGAGAAFAAALAAGAVLGSALGAAAGAEVAVGFAPPQAARKAPIANHRVDRRIQSR